MSHLSPEERAYRSRIVISCLLALFSINTLLLCGEAVLPTYIHGKHKAYIDETKISIILGAPEIAALVLASSIGILLDKWGRKNVALIGFVMLIAGVLGFAFIDFVNDSLTFFILSCIFRFIQGAGDITVQTCVFSIVTSTFTENREKYLGLGEMAAGTGLLVGPILGGWIYATFNYFWCYICLAILVGCDMFFTFIYMPNSLNNNEDDSHVNETAEEKEIRLQEEKRLSRLSQSVDSDVKYSWIIFNRRALFALISCGMVMVFEYFKSAFMTVYLEEQGVGKQYHGWIIGIPPLFYIISGNVIGHVIDKAPRRIFMFSAFIFMTLALFLMGPSNILGFPKKIWIFFIGYAVNGLASGFVFIPILPEVIESVYMKRNLVEGDNEILDGIINDKAAALDGLVDAIGAIISPLIGSFVFNFKKGEKGDWYFTCDVFAIMCASYALLFLVFNVLPDIHKEKQQRKELLEK